MSYVLQPFLVELAKLRAVVGSKDLSIVEATIEHNPDAFDLDDDNDEAEDDDELTLLMALKAIVMGNPLNAEDVHQYGYALEELCDYLGEPLPSNAWNGVRWAAVERCGLVELLTKSGLPIELPPSSDFPYIGHISREQLQSHLQAARLSREKMVQPDIQDLLDEYLGWLETANTRGLDIVLFYH